MTARVDLEGLGLDEGGHLLIRHALAPLEVGDTLVVDGSAPHLEVHLGAFARAEGHKIEGRTLTKRIAGDVRARNAERAGALDAAVDAPPASWGLAPRGALVERGGPAFRFNLDDKDEVWADEVGRLYEKAAGAQWDPVRSFDWAFVPDHPPEIEDAVVQVMTYLIENETAALIVPARFCAQVHPHFREVMQLLAIQAADEARHIEVFTRRAKLTRDRLALSTTGGQASLKTLVDEPDFALASFMLSVLGEGSFLDLLWFLNRFGPDPLTRDIAKLTAQDEARHVAFGVAHLTRHIHKDPSLKARLESAVRARHDALKDTTGLNASVFDALVLLSSGSYLPADLRRGYGRVTSLVEEMEQGRVTRLEKLGFESEAASALAALHTKNFM